MTEMEVLRIHRNWLLKDSDWTQFNDSPLSDSKKAEWATYRQALRDITKTAKPKIADYPFTTLRPNLGVVQINSYSSFVVADIPGLIPGASKGVGLGTDFLKHLSRVKILLHLIDIENGDLTNIKNLLKKRKVKL